MGSLSNEIEIIYYRKVQIEQVVELKNILEATDVKVKVIDIYFKFLLEQGYLKITHLHENEEKIKVKIPNKEIEGQLRRKIQSFIRSKNLDTVEAQLCTALFDKISTSDKINRNRLK